MTRSSTSMARYEARMRKSRRTSATMARSRGSLGVKVDLVVAVREVIFSVRGDQDGELRSPVDCVPQPADRVSVEGSGGLVEQQQLRVAEERAGERDLLEHPAGAPVHPVARDVGDLQLVLDRSHLAGRRAPGGVTQARVEEQVLVTREAQIERSLLGE